MNSQPAEGKPYASGSFASVIILKHVSAGDLSGFALGWRALLALEPQHQTERAVTTNALQLEDKLGYCLYFDPKPKNGTT